MLRLIYNVHSESLSPSLPPPENESVMFCAHCTRHYSLSCPISHWHNSHMLYLLRCVDSGTCAALTPSLSGFHSYLWFSGAPWWHTWYFWLSQKRPNLNVSKFNGTSTRVMTNRVNSVLSSYPIDRSTFPVALLFCCLQAFVTYFALTSTRNFAMIPGSHLLCVPWQRAYRTACTTLDTF
jgi:hypothetical protein